MLRTGTNYRDMAAILEKAQLVVAIDIGTSFSGYAFSFKSAPEDIKMNKNWGSKVGFQSYKTSTVILATRHGEFVDFGFDAEHKYSENQDDGKYLLFRHFKMFLFLKQEMKEHAPILSVEGRPLLAIDIFSHAIRYLKDHFLKSLKEQMGRNVLDSANIQWVLTVPAIWSDESKLLMRKAAFQAGCTDSVNSTDLMIALEPEAGSLCCRNLSITHYDTAADYVWSPGTKYLVMDCGGGTCDFAAHELVEDGKIKEILNASGGPFGGIEVEKNFVYLMTNILGHDFINRFKARFPSQWLEFLLTFETQKKSFTNLEDSKIQVRMPFAMGTLYTELYDKNISESFERMAKTGIKFRHGVIVIHHQEAKPLFQPVVDNIVGHVKALLANQKLSDIRYIFMVGGFSECSSLYNAVLDNFGTNNIKILRPIDAQMSIIKGAVLSGHNSSNIATRISRYSYGFATSVPFDRNIHKWRKRCVIDGDDYCSDVFHCVVSQGESVAVGQIFKHLLKPTSVGERFKFKLYRKDEPPKQPVEYIDNPGVELYRKFMSKFDVKSLDEEVEVEIKLGGPEINVKIGKVVTSVRL